MTKYCLSCFEEIKSSYIRRLFEKDIKLCSKCIEQIDVNIKLLKVDGNKILFLSTYDGILKSWLMNFKEYGDIALAPCFLYLFIPIIKLFYSDYIFLPLPSSRKRNENRGFVHLEEMLKPYNFKYLNVFEKEDDKEQKNNDYAARRKEKQIFLNNNKDKIKDKKVVLFDDIYTSGQTYKDCKKALIEANPKKIKGLIIMDNRQSIKLKIN